MDMESFTVEEFEERFDELFERVEDGESFIIVHEGVCSELKGCGLCFLQNSSGGCGFSFSSVILCHGHVHLSFGAFLLTSSGTLVAVALAISSEGFVSTNGRVIPSLSGLASCSLAFTLIAIRFFDGSIGRLLLVSI